MTSLAIVLPTRRRRHWLVMQLRVLSQQLKDGDTLVLVIDCDELDGDIMEAVNQIPHGNVVLMHLHYDHSNDFACVNRIRNAGAAMAPPGSAIVEVDDHDILKPDALERIRKELDDGAAYVFANCDLQAILKAPGGRLLVEPWPTVQHNYSLGAFCRNEVSVIGTRAIARHVWDAEGGWNPQVFPGGDFDLAQRIEINAPSFVRCLDDPLCTVTTEPDSISGTNRGESPLTTETQTCQPSPSPP